MHGSNIGDTVHSFNFAAVKLKMKVFFIPSNNFEVQPI